VYYVRQPSGWRRLNPGEAVRDDAVLAVTKPWNAYGAALAGAQQWLGELERIDRRFPHDPALAKHLSEWYELLSKKVIRPRHEDLMLQYAGRSAQWAEAAISRKRLHADVWVTAGLAYWRLANVDKSAQRGAAFEKAISYFEKAPPLAPTMPQYLAVVAYGMRELAKGYDQPATQARSQELFRLAGEYHSRARALYEERSRLGLPYMPSFYGVPEENPDQ
jgi:tetratricopeptide (TPR) repeat protein